MRIATRPVNSEADALGRSPGTRRRPVWERFSLAVRTMSGPE